MADFLLVVGDSARARSWFERGLARAGAFGLGEPSDRLAAAGVQVAVWPRLAGVGPRIARRGDRWIVAAGTWLHDSGFGPGSEARLLEHDVPAERLAREIEGFFALVHGDARTATLITDPIASHQVALRDGDGAAAAAGSALLLQALEGAPRLDPIGAQELLATGVVYEDRTPWADVRRAPPGSVLRVTERGIGPPSRWWSSADLEPDSLSVEAAVDALATSVPERLRALGAITGPPVSDLTGGWDSRLLVALLRSGGLPFETTVTGSEHDRDVVVSRRAAAVLGARHHVFPEAPPPSFADLLASNRLTDGEVDPIDYARVARIHGDLAQRFGISLNGSFGEVARAYWWEILSPSPAARQPLDAARIARSRYAAGAAPVGFWPSAARLDPIRHFTEVVQRVDREIADAPLSFRLDHTYLRMRMRSWQGRIASSTDRIWPCLSPLMFRAALEPMLRCRSDGRRRHRFARRLLRRLAPELAALPLESGGPADVPTVANAWRFLPEVWRRGQKAARRVLHRRSANGSGYAAAARLGLWRDARFAETFDAARMALTEHVDPEALARFLAAAREPDFRDGAAFGRLVGLELALRALHG